MVLPPFIIDQITASRYAALVVADMNLRRVFLSEISSLHTKQELAELRLGASSIRKIEAWLLSYGMRLRQQGESLDTVICGFGTRKLVRLKKRSSAPARSSPSAERIAA